ncbi:MAG: DUF642 domain-containing protein [Cellvibrio sp.]|jgi:hypothetical protein|uniref:hypothetical protein n=1 Tax=Cellvibrio sp. TaxID=1965322 RepID=UPI00272085D4|nr:DUF642 domain-containing protein [Cellvibrio sp.]
MLIKSIYTRGLGIFTGLLLAMTAQANLIVNGGFEDNNVAAGNWGYFSSANVNGWDGDNIEIWDSYGGVVAPEGTQHAELNAHPFDGGVFSIYQSFATVLGQTYDVSFFYSARDSVNEQFSFSVAGLNATLTDHVKNKWEKYTGSFVASSNLSTITFTTYDAGTLGNFLDDVVVTARATVVESNPLVMLLIGLGGLLLARKKHAGINIRA